MVRTRKSANYVVSLGKSPKVAAAKSSNGGGSSASVAPSSSRSTPGKSKQRKYSGGNPICPRETPAWQKEITCFFQMKDPQDESVSSTGQELNEADEAFIQEQDTPGPSSAM